MEVKIKENFYIRTKIKDFERFKKIINFSKDRINNFYKIEKCYLDFVLLTDYDKIILDLLKNVNIDKANSKERDLILFFLNDVNSIKDISKLLVVVLISLLIPKQIIEKHV